MGKGKRLLNRGGVWDRIFGGYTISYIQTLDSGNPMNFDFETPNWKLPTSTQPSAPLCPSAVTSPLMSPYLM